MAPNMNARLYRLAIERPCSSANQENEKDYPNGIAN